MLSHLIARTLLGETAVMTVAVDDTLFKCSGRKVFGAAWQHDGSAKGRRPRTTSTVYQTRATAESPSEL